MGSKTQESPAHPAGIDFAPIRGSFELVVPALPMFALLGLIAATGRALQVGAAGEPGTLVNIALEIVVEGARVALFLLLLGSGSIAGGWAEVRRLFTKEDRRTLVPPTRDRWPSLAVNLVIYAVIVAAANAVIYVIAHLSPALERLHGIGWIAPQADHTVIVLFLKNLTVIPWTLAIIAALIHWFLPTEPGTGSERGK